MDSGFEGVCSGAQFDLGRVLSKLREEFRKVYAEVTVTRNIVLIVPTCKYKRADLLRLGQTSERQGAKSMTS